MTDVKPQTDVIELTPYEALTPAMRHVVDALAEGVEPSPSALAALSPDEVQQVQLLSRTARLTSLSLHQPAVRDGAEADALNRAQTALARRPGSPPLPTPGRGGLLDRLRRLRGGARTGDEEDA